MKKVLSITIEADALAKLFEIAKRENRTISNLIETIVIKYLEENYEK